MCQIQHAEQHQPGMTRGEALICTDRDAPMRCHPRMSPPACVVRMASMQCSKPCMQQQAMLSKLFTESQTPNGGINSKPKLPEPGHAA